MERKALSPAEQGFLLLTSNLGDPDSKPLTVAQFRELTARSGGLGGKDGSRDVEASDLVSIGYSGQFARHIVGLLRDEELLAWYLLRARRSGCVPVTRASQRYPLILRRRLGTDSPGVLWARGDIDLLDTPAIALVGSRELREENRAFAEEAGRQAALQGLTLVSGNARGADKTAQNACLAAGGRVISIVADPLEKHTPRKDLLYLSENGFDEPFSAQRALSRNRCIHALGRITLVAQADLEKGGTWDGTMKNLHRGWSPVICFRDGSLASLALERQGAYLADMEALTDLGALREENRTLFDL